MSLEYQGGVAFMRDKEYFDTLCNTADGVFIVDEDKRILKWNKGMERILGQAEAEVLNWECFRVVSGRCETDKLLCNQDCRIHSNAFNGTPQENFDIQILRNDEEPLWLNVSVLSPADGKKPFLAHIVRDITQQKKKELAVDQLLIQLQAQGKISGATSSRRRAAAKPSDVDEGTDSLSTREIEVLTWLAEGLSTKALAQTLNISHFTARNHIQNILVKLNLHSKAQAVSYAYKKGIL